MTIQLIKIGPETETVTETYTDENGAEQTRDVERPVETVIVSEAITEGREANAQQRYSRQAALDTRDAEDGATYTHRVVEE